MKPRLSILIWLCTVFASFGVFELYTQYLYRFWYRFPHEDFTVYLDSILPKVDLLPLVVFALRGSLSINPLQGFEVEHVVLDDTQVLPFAVYQNCCKVYSSDECRDSLARFSELVSSKFHLVHDSTCINSARDHVMVSSTRTALKTIASVWNTDSIKFEFPFSFGNPIVVVRVLLVGEQPFASLTGLDAFISQLPFDVFLDRTVVQNADIETVFTSERPYEQLAIWEGSSHILPYGTLTMPPLRHIALVLDSNSTESVSIDDWGVVTRIPPNSDILNPIVSVLRIWLGLGVCRTEFCSSTGISQTERLLLESKANSLFIKTAINNLSTVSRVYKGLPNLSFSEHALLQDLKFDLTSFPMESATSKKIAATSFELLTTGTAPSHFSIEFHFALYAPLFLPMSLPVITVLWQYFRR